MGFNLSFQPLILGTGKLVKSLQWLMALNSMVWEIGRPYRAKYRINQPWVGILAHCSWQYLVGTPTTLDCASAREH